MSLGKFLHQRMGILIVDSLKDHQKKTPHIYSSNKSMRIGFAVVRVNTIMTEAS